MHMARLTVHPNIKRRFRHVWCLRPRDNPKLREQIRMIRMVTNRPSKELPRCVFIISGIREGEWDTCYQCEEPRHKHR